jgi:tetratricopeptide (TPR) repeat protein
MTPRQLPGLLLALTWAAGLGCGGATATGRPEDDARARARAFWEKLHAGNRARLRSDCGTAARLYEETLALDAVHEDALYYLGQCRRELGDPRAARAAFERLVKVQPASARGHLALGSLLASPDAAEPMDLPAAEAHLRRAHEINREETGPLLRLGELLLVTGRQQEAGQLFEAALRTNPKSVEAAFLAGFVGWQNGAAAVAPLARRVREAARVEAPVKGVLGEGDRRDATRAAAPPTESPLGRLLFGAPIAALRRRAAAGEPIDDAFVASLWPEARRQKTALAARARTAE